MPNGCQRTGIMSPELSTLISRSFSSVQGWIWDGSKLSWLILARKLAHLRTGGSSSLAKCPRSYHICRTDGSYVYIHADAHLRAIVRPVAFKVGVLLPCRVSPDSIELAAMELDRIAVLPAASKGKNKLNRC